MRLRYQLLVCTGTFLAVTVFLSLVTDDPPTQTVDVQSISGRWSVVEIDDRVVMIGVNAATAPWVSIDGGEISGNHGCNDFQGPYAIDGDRIVTEVWTSTAMACGGLEGDGLQETEVIMTTVLSADGGFDVFVEPDLMVWTGEGHEIVLSKS